MTCRVIIIRTLHNNSLKTNWQHPNVIVPVRSKVMILRHNRLDATSFFQQKLWKQTKNCTNMFKGPIKILGTDGNRKHGNFFRPYFISKGWWPALAGVETCQWSTTHHLDPPDLSWHGCYSDWNPAASGGQTVLANNRNGGRLRLIASRHYLSFLATTRTSTMRYSGLMGSGTSSLTQ